VEQCLGTVENTTSALQTTMNDVETNRKHSKLKKWLCPFDASMYHCEAQKQHFPSSGEWLMADPRFKRWLRQPHTFLWLFGLPGCGKTVLSSMIIDHLGKTGICLGFYITFLEKETLSLDSLLRSLIWQLCCKHKASTLILQDLRTLCLEKKSDYPEYRQPRTQELIMAFTDMLRLDQEIWIVIDALDECLTEGTRDNAKSLMSWIKKIAISNHNNLHLLVTSRKEDEIQVDFETIASPDSFVDIAGKGLKNDIKRYVQARISQSDELQRWKNEPDIEKEIRERIQAQLIDRADGMFRYVACQIEELEMCLSVVTLREALKNLPKGLDETYSRIMTRVFGRYRMATVRIFQLLLYSRRPLRVEELIDAIAVQ
ncbi:hypothetical protein EJ07DRAFT_89865, partial [Lizonia empirigonia]